jgi:threonine dehydrogenase-like Zn-dependent dehydrogenase
VVRWPADELRRIPGSAPSRAASLSTLAEVVLNAIRRSPVGIGSRCAVLGLGLIGQITCRMLAVAGASVAWCRDPDPRRSALVPSGVPFRVVDDSEQPPDSCDVTFEASGHPAAMSAAGRLTRDGGTISVVSSPTGPTTFDFHDACNQKSLTIVGSHYFSHPPAGQRWDARQNGECYLVLVERDPDLWTALISEEISASDAPARYSTLQSQPPVAGILIRWR